MENSQNIIADINKFLFNFGLVFFCHLNILLISFIFFFLFNWRNNSPGGSSGSNDILHKMNNENKRSLPYKQQIINFFLQRLIQHQVLQLLSLLGPFLGKYLIINPTNHIKYHHIFQLVRQVLPYKHYLLVTFCKIRVIIKQVFKKKESFWGSCVDQKKQGLIWKNCSL